MDVCGRQGISRKNNILHCFNRYTFNFTNVCSRQYNTAQYSFDSLFFLDKPIPHSTLSILPSLATESRTTLLSKCSTVQRSRAGRQRRLQRSKLSSSPQKNPFEFTPIPTPPKKGRYIDHLSVAGLCGICVCERRGISPSCAVYRICHRPERGKRSDGWCAIAVWNNKGVLSCFVL